MYNGDGDPARALVVNAQHTLLCNSHQRSDCVNSRILVQISSSQLHSMSCHTCGMRKCISDQSSMRSFCSGVPVISRRRCAENLSRVCHRRLFQFFIMCASSRIRYFHLLRRNILASCRRIKANMNQSKPYCNVLVAIFVFNAMQNN